jgi:hypothetical protein
MVVVVGEEEDGGRVRQRFGRRSVLSEAGGPHMGLGHRKAHFKRACFTNFTAGKRLGLAFLFSLSELFFALTVTILLKNKIAV